MRADEGKAMSFSAARRASHGSDCPRYPARRLLRQPHKRETIATADPRNPGMSVKFFERLAGPRGELIREAHHGNGDGVAYAG
jgi:hypothetical protein